MRINRSTWKLLLALWLALAGLLTGMGAIPGVLASGDGSTQTAAPASVAAATQTSANEIRSTGSGKVAAADVKLLADFSNGALTSGGVPLPPGSLKLEGAASLWPGQGLAVYKGGVNEIADPSFEGAGWRLSARAEIDSSRAARGNKSLRMTGDGFDGTFAELAQSVQVVGGKTRTVSFDHFMVTRESGTVQVTLKAFAADGTMLGSASEPISALDSGWQRGGFSYELPAGSTYYGVEISGSGFRGVCYLDGFLSESKDYITPYFDGDSETCAWVEAATPQHLVEASVSPGRGPFFLRVVLVGALLLAVAAVGVAGTVIFGRHGKRLRAVFILIVATSAAALIGLLSIGLLTVPGFWPNLLSLSGSRLEAGHTYFYRVSAVDSQGHESPPSIEARAYTSKRHRQVTLSWDRDPKAVSYRVYRGDDPHGEDSFFELSDEEAARAWVEGSRQYDQVGVQELEGNTALFIDTGVDMEVGMPLVAPAADTAVAHGSASLRPDPDARVSNDVVGIDSLSDFWVAGEVMFDFASDLPYRPASFFEIGDPHDDTSLAVSTRYVPAWGDDRAKILLIKNGKRQTVPVTSSDPIPVVRPGSVIKYIAAQLYEPCDGLSAGVHLWYRIDNGEVRHIELNDTQPLTGKPLIMISKRYFFDYFGNNSINRGFAVVQGGIDPDIVGSMMVAGTIGERVAAITQPGATVKE